MSRFGQRRSLTIWPVVLPVLWAASCARPVGVPSDTRAAQHPVPFQTSGAPSARQAAAATAPDNSETGLPFHDPQNLPAGTLLTVRLKNPIFVGNDIGNPSIGNPSTTNPSTANAAAANPSANGTFEAVLDEPVVIEGYKLVPRGTPVEGRVESVRASNVGHNGGYVRLALDSMHVADATLPIQTASLFVRSSASDPQLPPRGSSVAQIRLEKGRRLTFRLTEPAYVAARQSNSVDR